MHLSGFTIWMEPDKVLSVAVDKSGMLLLNFTVWGKWGIIHATLKSSCGCFWNHVAYYYVLKSYVAHKLTIFNTAILLFCFCCSPDDETWDLSMIWHDFEKNEQRSVTCVWKEKKYCSCSIILIRIEAILSKKIYNNSENLFLKK